MGSIVGIDLGTTNSVVAKLDDSGRPTIVYTDDGENLTPSAVHFEDKKTVLVGNEAKKTAGIKPNTFLEFKREMGTKKTCEAFGSKLTPTELSGFVLNKLKSERTNSISEIREAVITIPANFANEAREATLEAAKIAKLDVKYIINEPTAAALYYAFYTGAKLNGTYAVYDLGGGTFDISIIEVKGYDVNVLASEGVQKLGGKDFDDLLLKIITEKYEKETGEKFDSKEFDYSPTDVEEDKKSLSKGEKVIVTIRGGKKGRTNITVTRKEFEKAISTLVAQAEMLCESALDEAGIKASEIAEVFLVGGSTRIPFVQQSVETVFGKKPVSFVNPDEVVALGAALYSAYKTDSGNLNAVQRKTLEKMKVQEIAGHHYGFISVSLNQERNQYEETNSIIIPKGEKIPCKRSEKFYTLTDSQTTIQCTVTQSSSQESDPRFVKIIWDGNLNVPSDRPAGQEITVTYWYDDNEVMQCSFQDVESGKEIKIDLKPEEKGSKSSSDLEKILIE